MAKLGRLDIVVNNAGIGYIMKSMLEFTVDEWDVILDVNLRGPFLFTKNAADADDQTARGGYRRPQGRIINIASQAAKSASPNLVPYTSSKLGLVGLTRVSAIELGVHGITVNAVCPNHVTTGLGAKQNAFRGSVLGKDTEGVLAVRKGKIPLGRVGLPEDTANACLFLGLRRGAIHHRRSHERLRRRRDALAETPHPDAL